MTDQEEDDHSEGVQLDELLDEMTLDDPEESPDEEEDQIQPEAQA